MAVKPETLTRRDFFKWATLGTVSLGLTGAVGTVIKKLSEASSPNNVPRTTLLPDPEPTKILAASTATPPPETPTPTASPTSEPATPTPETKKDVPCEILPTKYCSQGEVIYTKNSREEDQIYIGFNLPADVTLFAGQDGQVTRMEYDKDGEFKGFIYSVVDPNLSNTSAISFHAIGDLTWKNMASDNVGKGAPIGYSQNRGITNLGGYNLIITIRQRTPNRPVPNESLLKRLFARMFIKSKSK